MTATWEQAREVAIDGSPTIGGSEAGSVLGVDPWTPRLLLWARKLGIEPPKEQTPEMEAGKDLEGGILRIYGRRTGRQLVSPAEVAAFMLASEEPKEPPPGLGEHWRVRVRLARSGLDRSDPWKPWDGADEVGKALLDAGTFVHYGPDDDGRVIFAANDRPWQIGTLDTFAKHPDLGWGVVDVKNLNLFKRGDWLDDEGNAASPLHYRGQCAHYSTLTPFRWSGFAVMFGGQDLGWVDEERDPVFEAQLLREEALFVRLIREEIEPDVRPSADTLDAIKARWRASEQGKVLEFPADGIRVNDRRYFADDFDRAWLEAEEAGRAWDRRRKDLEAGIRAAIGDAEELRFPDGTVYRCPTYWKGPEAEPRKGYFYRRLTRKGAR